MLSVRKRGSSATREASRTLRPDASCAGNLSLDPHLPDDA
ncbi:hypothetical protein FM113_11085 [Leucobacter sp. 7(1)]|nr:hypothetical protein FM113_11085 [Leucobacter sp. 7(1)]